MIQRDWLSERILFGLLIICGYFGVGILAVVLPLSDDARQSAKDLLLVVGPLMGVIVQAIWQKDKVDKLTADTAAVLAGKAPDMSTMTVVAAATTPPEGSALS